MVPDVEAWRYHVVAEDGPASHTMRYLLLFLSLHMKDGVCRMTLHEIAAAALLDYKTVNTHLNHAVRTRWVARRYQTHRTKRWRTYEYLPWWPGMGTFHAELADGIAP